MELQPNKYPELNTWTIRDVLKALPQAVISVMQNHRVFLAGGFIRAIVAGEKPSDIDLWVSSREEADRVSLALVRESSTAVRHESPNSFTIIGLGRPIQVIHRWCFEGADAILDSFDYTIAQAVIYWEPYSDWYGWCGPRFYDDVKDKQLTYLAPARQEEVCGSLFRLFKFYKRGYNVSLETLAAVMARATSHYNMLSEATTKQEYLKDLQCAGRALPKAPVVGALEDPLEDVELVGTGTGSKMPAGSC